MIPPPELRTTRKLLIFLLLAIATFEAACIGRQPSQQGTWSGQDGFKTRVSDQAAHSPQNPEKG